MRKTASAILLILALLIGCANAEGLISASVQVRASRSVYDSVIRTGEDADITVSIQGFTPAACLWYFEDELLPDVSGDTLSIAAAEVSDSGIYRMDALDASGRVRVSADVTLRVVDHTIPKTGDPRLPAGVIIAAMGACAVTTAALLKKKVYIQQKSS